MRAADFRSMPGTRVHDLATALEATAAQGYYVEVDELECIMIRVLSVGLCLAVASPSFAATSKAEDCGYQADVVGAVSAARVARVGERRVPAHVAGSAPEWPEKYNNILPLVTPWVYGMNVAEVKANNLAAAWNVMCLAQ